MQDTAELKGTIDRFLFQNNENGYSVLSLQIDEETKITATGYLPNLQAGQEVVLRGTWITHPKFGRQFEAKECVAQVPTSIVGLKKYLGSGLIKGIGPAYAEKLVGYFGEIVLDVIDKSPHRLKEVPGIGPKRIEQIANAWQDQKEISNVMVYLQDKGISTAYATKFIKHMGKIQLQCSRRTPIGLLMKFGVSALKWPIRLPRQLAFRAIH